MFWWHLEVCERSTASTDDDDKYHEFAKITASQSCNFCNRRKILFPRLKVKDLHAFNYAARSP